MTGFILGVIVSQMVWLIVAAVVGALPFALVARGEPSPALVAELRRRHAPLDLDVLFSEPEISRAANNLGLFEHVEAAAYERGFADARNGSAPT